jgi:hypothetical protein
MSSIGPNPYINLPPTGPKPCLQSSRFKTIPHIATGPSRPTDRTYDNLTNYLAQIEAQVNSSSSIYQEITELKMLITTMKYGKTWMHHVEELLGLIKTASIRRKEQARELKGITRVVELIRDARYEEAERASEDIEGAIMWVEEQERLREIEKEEEEKALERKKRPVVRMVPGVEEMLRFGN